METARAILTRFPISATVLAALCLLCTNLRAQTANWTGGGGDGLWNNPLNWDLDSLGINTVPAEGTNAVIGAGSTVTYAAPMAAGSFASLTLSGVLNVNAPGFTLDAAGLVPLTGNATALLSIGSQGVITITNSGLATLNTDSAVAVEGGAFIMSNNLPDLSGVNLGLNGNNNGAGFTNNGGTVILDQPLRMRGRYSRFLMNGGTLELRSGGGVFEGSNDQERPWLINGGVARLGDFSVSRTTGGGGLLVSNGAVTVTSLRVGTANSRAYATIYGGTLTNSGVFTICDRTNGATSGDRRIRFLLRGGTVVSTAPEGIIVANQSNLGGVTDAVIGATLDITAGTLIAEKLTLVRDTTLENAHATLALSGSGTVCLGGGGLEANVGVTNTSYRVNLNGGVLAAKDHYTIKADLALGGATATLQAANASGVPYNITVNGVVSGSGTLVKTGGGVLTLNGANTYSGNTIIGAGTLSLGPAGSIAASPNFLVSSGAVLDVSAVSGYALAAGRTLAGSGTVAGDVLLAAGATVNPGSNVVAGTLTFTHSLTETGGTVNHLDLSTNPSGPNNDLIVINGDLNVSGANTLEVSGGGPAGSVHPLIRYGGNFNGSLASFTLLGTTGSLSNNNDSAKGIYLVLATTVRSATNVTWVGNPAVNDWDTLNRTNWLNRGTLALDYFVAGDSVRFDTTGAANPVVNLVGNVSPSAVTVDAAANYTFAGTGAIAGLGGLTKTNAGTLTVSTTNTYTGVTVLGSGVLEASSLANGGTASSIGAASAAAENLVFHGGVLGYTGASASTDRGATLNDAGGTLEVATDTATLTLNGTLTGAGGLAKDGPGALVLPGVNSYQGVTTVHNGTLRVNTPGAAGTNAITLAGGTLFLGLPGDNDLLNSIQVTAPSGLAMGGANNRVNGAVSGDQPLNVTVNAGLVLTLNGNLTNFNGTFALGNSAGTFRFNSGGGNTTFGCPNATVDLGLGTAILQARNAGTMSVGALKGGPGTGVLGQGSGSGTLIWQIGSSTNNPSTTFEGTIADATTARLAALTKVGPGKLTLTGTNSYTGPTLIEEGTLHVDGSLGNTMVSVTGGTLAGSGILNGPVDIQAGGTLSPGSSIGQLTINNSLTLQPGSTTVMEVNKNAATQDAVIGLGSVSFGGTLVVSNLAGILADGDSFKLFDALPGTYYGAFEAIVPATPGAGLTWEVSNLPVDGTLKVTGGGAPMLNYAQVGTGLQFSWTGSYKLQAQTNALNVGLSGNWVDYPGGDTSGVSVPVDPASPTVFFRLATP